MVTFKHCRRYNVKECLEEKKPIVKMIPRAIKWCIELPHIWRNLNLFWRRLIPSGSSKVSNYIKSSTLRNFASTVLPSAKKQQKWCYFTWGGYNLFNQAGKGNAHKSTAFQSHILGEEMPSLK